MGLLSRKSRTKGVSDPAKLLITEHQKVERLFDQLDAATGAVERQGLIAQLDAELSAHTAKEESILYPFVAKHVPKGPAMVHDANHEHGLAKQALADLVSMDPGDDRLAAVAKQLQKLVVGHVKEEEKALFPALEKAVSKRDLAGLRGELEAAKFAPIEHPLETSTREAPAKRSAAKKAAP
jgi:iron-sulfur cluster repair protein YtfE (RIC family)